MRTLLSIAVLAAAATAQANCNSLNPTAAQLWTQQPFAGNSLYGHPGYPNPVPAGFPGFSFLVDVQAAVNLAISEIDIDLYDDGGNVQVNSTTVVVSPNQVGATAPVTVYLWPGPTWVGNENSMTGWGPLGTGTLTVAPHHTPSPIVFNPPIVIPAGTWGVAIDVPVTQNGPNPGPLHPMVNPLTTVPGVYSGPAVVLTNVQFQRESWTMSVTSPGHTQNLAFHYQPQQPFAHWTSYGDGCGFPEPVLGLAQEPLIGTTVDFVASNVNPLAAFNFFMIAFAPDPTGTSLAPFGLPTCTAYLDITTPIITTLAGVTNQMSIQPLTIPNDPSFQGVNMWSQAAPLIGSGGLLFHVSNAICIAIY